MSELTDRDTDAILGFAGAARFVGACFVVLGALLGAVALSAGTRGLDLDHALAAARGALALLAGALLMYAGRAFRRVVVAEGSPTDALARALGTLRRTFITLGLALVAVAALFVVDAAEGGRAAPPSARAPAPAQPGVVAAPLLHDAGATPAPPPPPRHPR